MAFFDRINALRIKAEKDIRSIDSRTLDEYGLKDLEDNRIYAFDYSPAIMEQAKRLILNTIATDNRLDAKHPKMLIAHGISQDVKNAFLQIAAAYNRNDIAPHSPEIEIYRPTETLGDSFTLSNTVDFKALKTDLTRFGKAP